MLADDRRRVHGKPRDGRWDRVGSCVRDIPTDLLGHDADHLGVAERHRDLRSRRLCARAINSAVHSPEHWTQLLERIDQCVGRLVVRAKHHELVQRDSVDERELLGLMPASFDGDRNLRRHSLADQRRHWSHDIGVSVVHVSGSLLAIDLAFERIDVCISELDIDTAAPSVERRLRSPLRVSSRIV